MQQIIYGEIRSCWLLHFEKVFNEEKVAYEKFKVCEFSGKCKLQYFVFFIFVFILYASSC
jgi:hypothetical protein